MFLRISVPSKAALDILYVHTFVVVIVTVVVFYSPFLFIYTQAIGLSYIPNARYPLYNLLAFNT